MDTLSTGAGHAGDTGFMSAIFVTILLIYGFVPLFRKKEKIEEPKLIDTGEVLQLPGPNSDDYIPEDDEFEHEESLPLPTAPEPFAPPPTPAPLPQDSAMWEQYEHLQKQKLELELQAREVEKQKAMAAILTTKAKAADLNQKMEQKLEDFMKLNGNINTESYSE
ncbi:MAG: hypothetical protein V4543_15475 [Bacteroidota bacterium]